MWKYAYKKGWWKREVFRQIYGYNGNFPTLIGKKLSEKIWNLIKTTKAPSKIGIYTRGRKYTP